MLDGKEKLAGVQARIAEYRDLDSSTSANITNLEDELVAGKNVGAEVQKKRTFLQSVRDTLTSLLGQEAKLKEQLAAEADRFEGNSRLRRMGDLARSTESEIASYGDLILEASGVLSELGEKLAARRIAINSNRREFARLQKESGAVHHTTGLGVTADQLRSVTESKLRTPTVPLGEVIGDLEARVIARMERDRDRPRAA